MPRPSIILRMVGFAVAAALAIAGIQPVIAAASGAVPMRWAVELSAPAVITAVLVLLAARIFNQNDALQPPWYSAWLLLPGSFLLAGAAAMCIFGAFVELSLIPGAMWALLVSGSGLWIGGMALVRSQSH